MTVRTKYIWDDKIYCRLRRAWRKQVGGNHRKFKKKFSKKDILGELLQVGDIIQTCQDGFNHIISEIDRDYYRTDLVSETGACHSWEACCGRALTPKEIEQNHLNHCQDVLFGNSSKEQHFAWYGNTDEGIDKWNKTVAWYQMLYDRLTAGQPICDDNGLVLPECEYKRD